MYLYKTNKSVDIQDIKAFVLWKGKITIYESF